MECYIEKRVEIIGSAEGDRSVAIVSVEKAVTGFVSCSGECIDTEVPFTVSSLAALQQSA